MRSNNDFLHSVELNNGQDSSEHLSAFNSHPTIRCWISCCFITFPGGFLNVDAVLPSRCLCFLLILALFPHLVTMHSSSSLVPVTPLQVTSLIMQLMRNPP